MLCQREKKYVIIQKIFKTRYNFPTKATYGGVVQCCWGFLVDCGFVLHCRARLGWFCFSCTAAQGSFAVQNCGTPRSSNCSIFFPFPPCICTYVSLTVFIALLEVAHHPHCRPLNSYTACISPLPPGALPLICSTPTSHFATVLLSSRNSCSN